jgi:hypothetical protein
MLWSAVFALAGVLLLAPGAEASSIEIFRTREAMAGEGYLQHLNLVGRFGNEVTGWVDVRHPALDQPTNSFEPYDRSNHFVNVRTTVVTAEMEGGGADVAASPDIQRDLHRSNKIYAQAGMSVVHTESGTLNLDGTGGRPDVQWPIDQNGEDDAMKASSRSANARTVNTYYLQKYKPIPPNLPPNGLTSPPSEYAPTNNDGSGIADAARDSTFAHEVGHMILNGPAVHSESVPNTESNDPKNWMFESGSSYAFNQIGRNKGRIESSQIDRLYANFGANARDFVQTSTGHEDYGNRVDWDFVTDDVDLEGRANGADDHLGVDSLYFSLGTTAALAHAGHDHTGLEDFVDLGDFTGPTFRVADIFSMSLLYADFDRLGAAGDFSRRRGALDYDVFFRDSSGGLHAGILYTVFGFGWTASTIADDYLGRWRSPVEATGVFVLAKRKNRIFDGNVQIDAVIVSNDVPEPSTVALLAVGFAAMGLPAMRRRRKS